MADPKTLLHDSILETANVTGRKRQQLAGRFSQSRRQLLERLDSDGPVASLDSWQHVVTSVKEVVAGWATTTAP
ncbi:MAG: hypothetical protein L0I76_01125 [Pseudonocardia sp.]|nr:hypothetical protein [Pseudonocardia sp.]